ncbi:MAG: ParA family protein [Proteobacteria bacterium]|nr:ParA family protein [Pseudomonadota bacterium]
MIVPRPSCRRDPDRRAYAAFRHDGSRRLAHVEQRVRTRVIAIANQKGGVGKTTTVAGLGAALASRGHRVLLIDLDPQANLTSSLGVAKDLRGTYEVLMREVQLGDAVVDVSAACLRSVPDGACVSLVPASPDLAGTDTELASATDRAGRLRSAVIPYAGSYAFVLVDCPPPVQCEYLALEGLTQLLGTLRRVRDRLNPDLRRLHLAMTMFDGRTGLSQGVVEEVRRHFADLILTTTIPRTVRLAEAPSHGQGILRYDPSGRGAEAYRTLAAEIEARGDLVATVTPAPES